MKYLIPIIIMLSLLLVACTASEAKINYNIPDVPQEVPPMNTEATTETTSEPIVQQPAKPELKLMTISEVANKCEVNEAKAKTKMNYVEDKWPHATEFNIITCNAYTGTNAEQKEWSKVDLYLIKYSSEEEATGAYMSAINNINAESLTSDMKWIDGDVKLDIPRQLTLGTESKGFLFIIENNQGELQKVFETYSYKDNLLIHAVGVTAYKPYTDGFMFEYHPTTELLMNSFVRTNYLLQ